MEFHIHHQPESLRALYRALWRERYGLAQAVSWVLAISAMTFMMLLRAAPWYLVVLATVSIIVIVLITSTRDSTIARGLEHLESMGPAGLRYSLTEQGLEEVSSLGQFSLQWSAFHARSESAGYLVLWRVPKNTYTFVSLPLDQLPAAAREQINRFVPSR